MTRFQIPFRDRRILKTIHTVDVYSHRYLEHSKRTIEHIVPVRVLKEKKAQLDMCHLFVTSSHVNRFRSDYAFGGRGKDEIYLWEQLDGCYRDKKTRVFYPKEGHRLVAHVVWEMMQKYPSLSGYENKVFKSLDVWDFWLHKPWTPVERYMYETMKRAIPVLR